ncbi:ABC transporter permease [Anaeromicropila herbilytica]|uniref:ABC transporter permease n=2 Tax=Anaeromicropila herbilytica TaxID=2785025 RepID=A0A7R7EKB9_9FIRM|nr:ABC transporter permease [Anaeromicropila herbilytica]BCN30275.1 ABC transporter permease [Anaeromicropila herbilytica]
MKKLSKRRRKRKISNIAFQTMSNEQREYVKSYIKKSKRITRYRMLILVLFFAFWEFATRVGMLDSFIFSSPSRIVKCFIGMSKDFSIYYHISVTLYETFISFLLVIILSILIAILLWWNDSISKVLEPYLVVLNSLPKSALAPVFIVWLGNNAKTIIVAAISVAIFGSIINLYTDFITTEEDKIKLIKTLGGTKKDVLFKVVIPSNIPSMISIAKVNIGLTLVGVIIGEFLAAKAGLGYLIIYGSQVFKMDWVIMSITILCIVAGGLYKLISVVEKKFNY